MHIGEIIKQLRKQNKISQKLLSQEIGVSSGNIGDWESGRSKPGYDALLKIIKYFNISPNILFNFTNNVNTYNIATKVTHDNFTTQFYKLSDVQQERVLEKIETYLEIQDDVYLKGKKATVNNYSVVAEEKTTYIYNEGLTAAGSPIVNMDYTFKDLVAINNHIHADFALTVKGDSMEPDIKNGSTIYIKKQPNVENGTIAIISIDGAVTCKKFYHYSDHIILKSINPNYKPIIIYKNDNNDIHVIGEVLFL